MRDILLIIHIVGVAGWLGGGLHGVVTYSAVASTAPPVAAPALRALAKLDQRFYAPATLLVLLSGIGLVLTSEAYGWGDTFVIIGLVTFVIGGRAWRPSRSGWRCTHLTRPRWKRLLFG